MHAIFRGRRYVVMSQGATGVWLTAISATDAAPRQIHVAHGDPDLILDPTEEDLRLADAYEQGEISAFEYADGHTYPHGREIRRQGRARPSSRLRERSGKPAN